MKFAFTSSNSPHLCSGGDGDDDDGHMGVMKDAAALSVV